MQFSTSFIIAASQFLLPAVAAPLSKPYVQEVRSLVQRAEYKQYGGDGSPEMGWPKKEDWASFEEIWEANQDILKISCTYHEQENDTPEEIQDIHDAILQVAKEADLDERVLLVTAMQESNGCLRVKTTENGFQNPGIMQSFQGKHNCYGIVPCPKEQIVGMVQDGAGLNSEVGIKWGVADNGGKDDAQTYYKAARVYNSGHVADDGNLGKGEGATACYASDYANRLMGWAGDKTPCTEEIAPLIPEGITPGSNNSEESESSTPTTTSPPLSTGTATSGTPSILPATDNNGSTTDSDSSDNETSTSGCQQWYTVQVGDTCSSVNIQTSLNPEINAECTNLEAGKAYCIA